MKPKPDLKQYDFLKVRYLNILYSEPALNPNDKAVLFVHGSGLNGYSGELVMSYCSDRGYRTFSLSLRGHKPSNLPRRQKMADVTLYNYVEDIKIATDEICRRFGIRRDDIILMAHSAGGVPALLYAIEQIPKVEESIVAHAFVGINIEGGPKIEYDHGEDLEGLEEMIEHGIPRRRTMEEFSWLCGGYIPRDFMANTQRYERMLSKESPYATRERYDPHRGLEITFDDLLGIFSKHPIIVVSTHDHVVPPSLGEELEEKLDFHRIIVPNSGHMLPVVEKKNLRTALGNVFEYLEDES